MQNKKFSTERNGDSYGDGDVDSKWGGRKDCCGLLSPGLPINLHGVLACQGTRHLPALRVLRV